MAHPVWNPLLQQMPKGWYRGWRGIVARLDGMLGQEPAVPRKFRMALGRDAATSAAIKKVLGWPAERVIMAHGTPVLAEGAAFLRRAFLFHPAAR